MNSPVTSTRDEGHYHNSQSLIFHFRNDYVDIAWRFSARVGPWGANVLSEKYTLCDPRNETQRWKDCVRISRVLINSGPKPQSASIVFHLQKDHGPAKELTPLA